MTDDVWSRPRIPTGQSVAAALRLAKELNPDASLLCEGDGETTELLVRKRGELARYVVYESGAREQVETHRPTATFRIGRWLIRAGFLCVPLIIGAGFAFKPENADLWMGGPFAVAFALVFAGALLSRTWAEIDEPADALCAPIPHDFAGWQPRTVAQLAAVKKLYDEGDSVVRVRSLHDGGIEVETFQKRERRRDVLDARGQLVGHESSVVPARIHWLPRLLGLGILFPVLAIFVFEGTRNLLVAVAVYVVFIVIGAWIDSRKHVERAGEDWFSVQMEAPSD